jgi:hypothetical protein
VPKTKKPRTWRGSIDWVGAVGGEPVTLILGFAGICNCLYRAHKKAPHKRGYLIILGDSPPSRHTTFYRP